MSKTIITVAPVGSVATTEMSPYIPIVPKDIVADVLRCYENGASVVHLHVRDPETQQPSDDLELYREVVDGIRANTDMVINLTTSTGGRLHVDADGNVLEGTGSALDRTRHVTALKPEMCSLDVGTCNSGGFIFMNPKPIVDRMASHIKDAGVLPEIEIFEPGHINFAKELMKNKLIDENAHFQICLGTRMGSPASVQMAQMMVDLLPKGVTWSIFGVGRWALPMVAIGASMGGHVRVGMEDNLFLRKGVLAKGNYELVAKAKEIIEAIGGDVADAREARQMLGLRA